MWKSALAGLMFIGAAEVSAQDFGQIPGESATGTVMWVRSCADSSPFHGNVGLRLADGTYNYLYIPRSASSVSCVAVTPPSESRVGHILTLASSFPAKFEAKGLTKDPCTSSKYYFSQDTNVWANSSSAP